MPRKLIPALACVILLSGCAGRPAAVGHYVVGPPVREQQAANDEIFLRYLRGDTDELGYDGPCVVVARAIYRLNTGKDEHYLNGLDYEGSPHIVVLVGGLVYDPLWHKEPVPLGQYVFTLEEISEPDGWHYAENGQ